MEVSYNQIYDHFRKSFSKSLEDLENNPNIPPEVLNVCREEYAARMARYLEVIDFRKKGIPLASDTKMKEWIHETLAVNHSMSAFMARLNEMFK